MRTGNSPVQKMDFKILPVGIAREALGQLPEASFCLFAEQPAGSDPSFWASGLWPTSFDCDRSAVCWLRGTGRCGFENRSANCGMMKTDALCRRKTFVASRWKRTPFAIRRKQFYSAGNSRGFSAQDSSKQLILNEVNRSNFGHGVIFLVGLRPDSCFGLDVCGEWAVKEAGGCWKPVESVN